MTQSVTAVYENGVLRPVRPLELAEGEAVQVTVTTLAQPTDEEVAAMLREAKTLEEVFAIANRYITAEDGYDLCEALNENRRREGAPLLYPPESKGKTW